MDYYNLIETRESIRDYDIKKTLDKEILLRIVNAGRLAPSAANKQPWEFLVVSSAKLLEGLYNCYGKDWLRGAPHILVVKGNKDDAWQRKTDGYNALETDLTIAMDHMILAAEYEGVSTCWIAAFDKEKLYSLLELEDNEEIFAITPLGYPKDGFKKANKKTRKELDAVVRFL